LWHGGASAVFVPLAAARACLDMDFAHACATSDSWRPVSWLTAWLSASYSGLPKIPDEAILLPLLGAPAVPMFGDLANNPARHFLVFYMLVGAPSAKNWRSAANMFERLGKLLGTSLFAQIAVVILSTAFFGALHHQQISVLKTRDRWAFCAVVYLINRKRLLMDVM